MYDASQIANKQVLDFVNLKVKEIKEAYQGKLLEQNDRLQKLTAQIKAFREMGNEGNYGITFDQMNTEFQIKMLSKHSKDPGELWEMLAKYYGSNFFGSQIESEYGITKEAMDKVQNRIDKQIKEITEKHYD